MIRCASEGNIAHTLLDNQDVLEAPFYMTKTRSSSTRASGSKILSRYTDLSSDEEAGADTSDPFEDISVRRNLVQHPTVSNGNAEPL